MAVVWFTGSLFFEISGTFAPANSAVSEALFATACTATFTGCPIVPVGPLAILTTAVTLDFFLAPPHLDVCWTLNVAAVAVALSCPAFTPAETARLSTLSPLSPRLPGISF